MPTRCSMPFENFRSCSRRSAPMPTSSSSARHAAAALGRRVAEEAGEILEQLLGGQVVVEVGVLRQVADPALDVDVADRPPEDLGAAGRRIDQLHQQLERGGLAGAVRPEEAEDLALPDVERQRIERDVRARAPEADVIVLGKALGPNGVHRVIA